jgi:hypothetical protein
LLRNFQAKVAYPAMEITNLLRVISNLPVENRNLTSAITNL